MFRYTTIWKLLVNLKVEAGNICHAADIFRNGIGIVEYVHEDDTHMEYALKRLNGSRLVTDNVSITRILTNMKETDVNLQYYYYCYCYCRRMRDANLLI